MWKCILWLVNLAVLLFVPLLLAGLTGIRAPGISRLWDSTALVSAVAMPIAFALMLFEIRRNGHLDKREKWKWAGLLLIGGPIASFVYLLRVEVSE